MSEKKKYGDMPVSIEGDDRAPTDYWLGYKNWENVHYMYIRENPKRLVIEDTGVPAGNEWNE